MVFRAFYKHTQIPILRGCTTLYSPRQLAILSFPVSLSKLCMAICKFINN